MKCEIVNQIHVEKVGHRARESKLSSENSHFLKIFHKNSKFQRHYEMGIPCTNLAGKKKHVTFPPTKCSFFALSMHFQQQQKIAVEMSTHICNNKEINIFQKIHL